MAKPKFLAESESIEIPQQIEFISELFQASNLYCLPSQYNEEVSNG